ncbi:MAG: SCO family protein [Granulosicoccus sp.]
MIRISFFLMICLLSSATFAAKSSVVDNPPAMPDFKLTDHHNAPFNQDNLLGQWTLVLVGFTSCPDVCPYTLGNLEHVLAATSSKIRPDNLPKVVFLAVDPDRDSSSLSAYVQHFHPDFLGVTGDAMDIDAFVEGLDAFYEIEKPDSRGFYDVRHSADVRLIDPTGSLYATLQTPMNAQETSDFLLRMQIEYRKSIQ